MWPAATPQSRRPPMTPERLQFCAEVHTMSSAADTCAKNGSGSKASEVQAEGSEVKDVAKPSELGTSVMIRNLPHDITQRRLLEELDESGYRGLYDFAYMPCCFVTGKGKGFAFINFIDTETAKSLAIRWHRSRCFGIKGAEPALNVSAAAIQGWAKNVAKWNVPRMRRIRNPNLRPFVRDMTEDVKNKGAHASPRGKTPKSAGPSPCGSPQVPVPVHSLNLFETMVLQSQGASGMPFGTVPPSPASWATPYTPMHMKAATAFIPVIPVPR